ncbi:uncharacterized protein BDR25DRAFT_110798 [Lindgomyces ingoldianus]|uniref:Uncharacterized protein n=1 Tax=Lindgomyces ingoldianus TaxID=673940 RepID=A0ACB6R5Y8_9PLEO|nr:uncharacterized protein BDR25DRAFT_110798 [Lindgomyces ingoldianus]KAF2474654.1 hypothetical protein BDR25DRAFT_110798 [Lindgomyces ingoldianus]
MDSKKYQFNTSFLDDDRSKSLGRGTRPVDVVFCRSLNCHRADSSFLLAAPLSPHWPPLASKLLSLQQQVTVQPLPLHSHVAIALTLHSARSSPIALPKLHTSSKYYSQASPTSIGPVSTSRKSRRRSHAAKQDAQTKCRIDAEFSVNRRLEG